MGVMRLDGEVIFSGGVILNQFSVFHGISSSHSIDLLVNLSSVIVALLSSSRHGELDPARMPSSNTYNLPRQLLGMPSAGDTWGNYWVKTLSIRWCIIILYIKRKSGINSRL